MDEDGGKRVCDGIGGIDRLSSLPDSLICEILLSLPTKDVVKTSTLSSRWRSLWKYVPALDLEYVDFPDLNVLSNFVDNFLGFNAESRLQSFKIKFEWDEGEEFDPAHLKQWINTLVQRRVQHLHLLDRVWFEDKEVELPPVLYTCESLVSLKLSGLTLASPKFVSLPSLKALYLDLIDFSDDLAVETLISGSPVLESLSIERSLNDMTKVLRVNSQSLLSFSYTADGSEELEDLAVEILAPRLKYLRLCDTRTGIFIIDYPGSLVKVDIDTVFNLCMERKFDPSDLPKKIMMRKFLVGISCVRDMIIYTDTLEVLYAYSGCERLPLFRNMYVLQVEYSDYLWEMLPILLESCPNLKYLVVFQECIRYQEWEIINVLSRPRPVLPSLEYVEIETPLKGEPMELKLVSYLLEHSTNLKKLTLRLDDSVKKEAHVTTIRELLTIPRLSTSCQVVINSLSGDPYLHV